MSDSITPAPLPAHLSKPRLRRAEVSQYLLHRHGIAVAVATLAKWASTTTSGPPFQRFGAVPLYPVDQLDAWALARLGPAVRSTSEVA